MLLTQIITIFGQYNNINAGPTALKLEHKLRWLAGMTCKEVELMNSVPAY